LLTVTLAGEELVVKSVTVIWTLLGDERVTTLLVTVRFIVFTPNGQFTVGLAPLAVPHPPVQLKVNGQLFGSLDAVPFKPTFAPLGLVALRV